MGQNSPLSESPWYQTSTFYVLKASDLNYEVFLKHHDEWIADVYLNFNNDRLSILPLGHISFSINQLEEIMDIMQEIKEEIPSKSC